MSTATNELTPRERELGAIIHAYNDVTEKLKESHEQLREQVTRLRDEVSRKNRQLRRRERLAALGEMAAGVAHEIRNPLGGIQMFASLLQRDLVDRPDALRLAEKITKGVGRLEMIVTDILEFSRPADPSPGMVRLESLVHEMVEFASAKTAARGVTVEVCDTVAGIEFVTDAALLQRAMLNLLLNAVDAARHCVVIAVRSISPERVVLTISDDGPGIPADLMDRIFNPFFTTKDQGTGLGLAIVHQIIETLGGNIQAANRSGGGAVFAIYLPIVLAAEGAESAEKEEKRQMKNGISGDRALIPFDIQSLSSSSAFSAANPSV